VIDLIDPPATALSMAFLKELIAAAAAEAALLASFTEQGLMDRCSPRHVMPFNSGNEGWRRRQGLLDRCSPRHRKPFNSRNEGSKCIL